MKALFRILLMASVLALIFGPALAFASQVPNPINAPASVASGDLLRASGTNVQQAADSGISATAAAQNQVVAGPATGGAGTLALRALVAADIPSLSALGAQATLVSGTNIKTVGGVSLLGTGDVGTIGIGYGGTGLTSTPANGALDIGNGTNFTRTTLTQGTGITITNGAGSISIANAGVTTFSAGTTGLTPSTATSGAITLAGTLAVANGGTGSTTSTGTAASGVVLKTSPTITNLSLAAGTTSAAPLVMTSGTNLTTATAGAYEFDGTAFYLTAQASSRQAVSAAQWIVSNSTYTLTSTTSAQQLFNASSAGSVTLALGTYEFDCDFALSSMSATSGSFGFALGGTAVTTQQWTATANKSALATAAAPQVTYNTAANTAIATASTATTGFAHIRGLVRVTTAGTLIPQVSLGVAAAAVVGANAWCRIAAIGSQTVTTIGYWQ